VSAALGSTRGAVAAIPPKVARARKRDVAVAAVFKEKRERYGAPRVRAVLRARGEAMSRKSVAASMRAQGLVARPRRRFVSTTDSSHGRPTPPNLVNRNFCAAKPNEVWVADTTYLPTQSGFVYLVCVLDLFARRLVGWSVADELSADLAALALRRATAERRPPRGLVVHTDRGGEFLSRSWTAVLKAVRCASERERDGQLFRQRRRRELLLDPRIRGSCYTQLARRARRRDLPAGIS
jgi:putative transposase